MKKILSGMMDTMNSIKPPRITALQDLHDAETGHLVFLLELYFLQEPKMKLQQRQSKYYSQNIKIQNNLQMLI